MCAANTGGQYCVDGYCSVRNLLVIGLVITCVEIKEFLKQIRYIHVKHTYARTEE